MVHVIGAVARPGVYQLPSGARAEDAVALAGGLTDEADPGSLNLAARLVDGQQVSVRSKAPTAGTAPAGPGPAAKLNINQVMGSTRTFA